MKIPNSLSGRVSAIILIVIAVFGALLLSIQALNMFTSKSAVPLTSNSMSPTIPTGSLLFTSDTPESQLEVGDIISVQVAEDEIMVGRLTDVNSLEGGLYSLTFIGDNKALPEPFPYQVNNMTSTVVFHIPVLGFLVAGLSSPLGVVILGIVALGAGVTYLFRVHRVVFLPRSGRRYRKARQIVMQRQYDKEHYMDVQDFKNLFAEDTSDLFDENDDTEDIKTLQNAGVTA